MRILILVLFALTVVSFQGTIGRDAGTAMLAGMLGLKLHELRSGRDRKLFCLLNYFLVLTCVLYFQSLPAALYMLFAAYLNSVALVRVLRGRGHWAADMRRVALILLQSVPLAVILFLFFPRLPGGLFGLEQASNLGVSGMSDFLAPGEISSLVMSGEPVFRASFSGKRPVAQDRYWRCMVFGDMDGPVWKAFPGCPGREDIVQQGESFSYELTVEKHSGVWVPVLGVPERWSGEVRLDCNGLLRFNRRLERRKRINLVSQPEARLKGGNPEDYLDLPQGVGPQARELAADWKGLPEKERVKQAVDFFREGDFEYTLYPGVMHGDYIDKFLFREMRGFCEHFAASFAFLMRAADLPSRVVVGYQGGEVNPLGGYVLVREKDAHAWVEIYISGVGWKRMDPVAMVAPQRVEEGFSPVDAGQTETERQEADSVFDWMQQAFFFWDAANNVWNQWVLDYSSRTRGRVLSGLKLDNPTLVGVVKISAIFLGLVFAAYFAVQFGRGIIAAYREDPVTREFRRFEKKMSLAGVARPHYMGPLDYLRLIESRCDSDRSVQRIVGLYMRLRYQGYDPGLMLEFRRVVREFDPRRLCCGA